MVIIGRLIVHARVQLQQAMAEQAAAAKIQAKYRQAQQRQDMSAVLGRVAAKSTAVQQAQAEAARTAADNTGAFPNNP